MRKALFLLTLIPFCLWLSLSSAPIAAQSIPCPQPFSITLINGDVNNDNFIEDQDYSIMGTAWYSQVGDQNYQYRADLNNDGWVEDQDYSIMAANWYVSGANILTTALGTAPTGNYLLQGTVKLGFWNVPPQAEQAVQVQAQQEGYTTVYVMTTMTSATGGLFTMNLPNPGLYDVVAGFPSINCGFSYDIGDSSGYPYPMHWLWEGVNAVAVGIPETVATPVFTPAGGTASEVSITCQTPTSSIFYTSDGSVPTQNSSLYTGPIPVTGNVLLSATAWVSDPNWTASAVATGAFQPMPSVVYVSTFGDDGNSGLSWQAPKRSVQAGINAAASLPGIANPQVWVASGTYYELTYICSSIGVYGGFAGNETTLASRDWNANETILDGFSSSPVVSISGRGILDGFTVQDAGTSGSPTSYGGGIYATGSPSIRHNYIQDNSALFGAGIYCDSCTGTAMVIDNIIVDNSAGVSGGGVFANGGSPIIANNTLVGNADSSTGGGIFCSGGTPTLANNIIAFNASGITNSIGSPVLFTNDVFNSPGIDYTGVIADTGSISANPQFVDSSGDYHLVGLGPVMWGRSPCIDAGYETAYDAIVPSASTDMDGNPRIHGPRVDMGAYEYGPKLLFANSDNGTQGVPVLTGYSMPFTHYLQGNGDINGDNFVEDQDYSLLGLAWYSQAGDSNFNLNADFNGDGFVEEQDYSILGSNWYLEGVQCFGSDGNNYPFERDAMSTGLIGTPGTGGNWLNGTIALANYTGGYQNSSATPWAQMKTQLATVYLQAYREGSGDPYFYTAALATTVTFIANLTDSTAGVGYARFSMQVPQPGEYTVWAKVSHWLASTGSVSTIAASGNYSVYYVSTFGSGKDGLTWATSFNKVQDGLAAAGRNKGGDVWVSAGVYCEKIGTDYNAIDHPADGVALYGGFVGNESAKSQRPAFPRQSQDVYATVLTSYGDFMVHVADTNHGTLAHGFALDGFTVANGNGHNSGLYPGGIYFDHSAGLFTMANDYILNNGSLTGAGLACYGDQKSSQINVHGCIFRGNCADGGDEGNSRYGAEGGAMYCIYFPYVNFSDNIVDCNTAGNHAAGLAIEDCGLAAGPKAPAGSSVRIANNLFTDNLVTYDFPNDYYYEREPRQNGGVGLTIWTTTSPVPPTDYLTNATIVNNTFSGNVCRAWTPIGSDTVPCGCGGGAIRCINSLCVCENDIFDYNSAQSNVYANGVGNSICYTGTTGSVSIAYCSTAQASDYFLCQTRSGDVYADAGFYSNPSLSYYPYLYRLADGMTPGPPRSPCFQTGCAAYTLPGDQSLDLYGFGTSNQDYFFYPSASPASMGCFSFSGTQTQP
jgi:hypothetical protein